MPKCYEIYNQKVKIYIGEEIPNKKMLKNQRQAKASQLKKLHIQIMLIL